MKIKNWETKEEKDINYKFTSNMKEVVECPECGKKIPYGETINCGEWFTTNGVSQFARNVQKKYGKNKERKGVKNNVLHNNLSAIQAR